MLPAGSGTFMSLLYSGGQNGMHNVVPCFPRLCLGKLGLSNTLVPVGSLSFLKPPHDKAASLLSLTVPDQKAAPGLR